MHFLSMIFTEYHTSKCIVSICNKSLPSCKFEEVENIYLILCKKVFSRYDFMEDKDIGSHNQEQGKQQHINEWKFYYFLIHVFLFEDCFLLPNVMVSFQEESAF